MQCAGEMPHSTGNCSSIRARLRIQTIDALNSMLARRLPVVSGTGAPLVPSTDPNPLYEAACSRLLEHIGSATPQAEALERLIVHLGNRVDRLTELISELLGKRDQWLHQIMQARSTADLRQTLERTLAGVIERHLAQLCESIPHLRRAEIWELTRFAAENILREPALAAVRRELLQACLQAQSAPGAGSDCIAAWRAVISIFFKADGDLYQKVSKKQGFPTTEPAAKARMQEALRWLGGECDCLRTTVRRR